MCGILGTIPKTEDNIFKNALDRLTHRGPDDYGVWHTNAISLGHRRLSIVDLSQQGHQPMCDAHGRYQIIFNGEIYNFIEVKKELETLGHRFMSHSDTEVVLAAYIQWREKALLKFNGMWAFAIWDNDKQELFMARDRFGKKPLFYTVVDNKFIFASEMKAIYPFMPDLSPSQDFVWMSENIFLYENTDKCLIKGIKRFPAGHYAYFNNNQLELFRYWNTLDYIIAPHKTYDEQVEYFRELFIDACKIRMRSDVPIGTALSGGLDSSATICTMAHIANKNISDYGSKDWQHAFVASFPGTELDESCYAKQVVDYIGINAKFININPIKEWEKIFYHLYMFEELYITSPLPMLMTYSAVRDNGVVVTLDGHGADELFSGYGHILEALWDAKLNKDGISDIMDLYRQTTYSYNKASAYDTSKLYLKFMIKKSISKVLSKNIKTIDFNHSNFAQLDNFSQHLYVVFHETILPTLLRNYDRYSMANSVEIRMPFMDYRIVNYVNSLPYSSKFGAGYTKKLIRDALSPFMPHDIVWRKSKIGFNSPIVNWMQGDLKEWFEDIALSQNFRECSLLKDSGSLKNDILLITNKKSSDFNMATKAWTRLTPFLWEQSIKQYAK